MAFLYTSGTDRHATGHRAAPQPAPKKAVSQVVKNGLCTFAETADRVGGYVGYDLCKKIDLAVAIPFLLPLGLYKLVRHILKLEDGPESEIPETPTIDMPKKLSKVLDYPEKCQKAACANGSTIKARLWTPVCMVADIVSEVTYKVLGTIDKVIAVVFHLGLGLRGKGSVDKTLNAIAELCSAPINLALRLVVQMPLRNVAILLRGICAEPVSTY